MSDFLITSLRGGLNEDAPSSLADDQCTDATNVEWFRSRLGERRLGSTAIDLTSAGLSGYNRVTWVYRHLPTTDPAAAQLWMLAIKDSPWTATFVYKNSSGWHTVAQVDALTQGSEYSIDAQTLHGKLFIAYNSAVDRLHVWDGTSLRRVGIAEPTAAPTGANSGGAGTLSGTRYARVRWTVQSGGVTLLRSEPSAVLTFTPSTTNASVTYTQPTTVGQDAGITHWELELSLDNANFYVRATTVLATTTFVDSTAFGTGYGVSYELSEDTGDYEVIPSVRYLTVEQDRLMGAGSFEDEAEASSVLWTPVANDPGVGNDERIPVDTDNALALDNYEGGRITAISATVNGYVFVGKQQHLYQLARSGVRTAAYEAICLTKARGVIEGSMLTALDNAGQPTLFALDPDIGAYLFGERGVEPCGVDLLETWDTLNLDATSVVSRSVYFPEKKQAHWWIATGSGNVPDTRVVLHTHLMRRTDEGLRGGWAVWDGGSAAALSACLFATNVDSMSSGASHVLAPVIAVNASTLAWRTDTGDDDNGTDYLASLKSKPLTHGNLLHQFECQRGALIARAKANVSLDITLIATVVKSDGTSEQIEKAITGVTTTASGSEDFVIRQFDDLGIAEARSLQVEFSDPVSPGSQWFLDQFALLEVAGQS